MKSKIMWLVFLDKSTSGRNQNPMKQIIWILALMVQDGMEILGNLLILD
jgi:hypothetical protein